MLQPNAILPINDPILFGQVLARLLFTPPLRELLLAATTAGRSGGRLQFQIQVAVPELVALPWELITIGIARPWSPALRDDYTLVRVGRSARPAPAVVVAGPLRILAAAAPGEGLQLEALEAALDDAVRAGRIDLRLLYEANPATLERALAEGPIHILHCAIPVVFSEQGTPRLLLERDLDAFELMELLANAAQLRLVTLAGPQGDGSGVSGALPVLATTLLSRYVPATIGFGGALPAPLAARFAATCYGKLAEGAPADLAVTAGRRALAEDAGRGWGLVQLRLTAGGEQLFTFSPRPRRHTRRRATLSVAGASAALLIVLIGAGAIRTRTINPIVQSTPAMVVQTPAALMSTAIPSAEPTAIPSAEPTAIPSAPPAPTTLAGPLSYATLLTSPDDTLASIAERMGSDPAAIVAFNHLDPQAPLRADRPLVVPVYRAGESGAGGMVIRRGNPSEPKVALTFDIEIDDRTLYGFLDILRARGIHGTFFLTGRWVQAYPDAARAIVNEGHEIGNHSLTHPHFSRIGLDGAASELDKTEQIILETTGVTSRPYFRFPYGDFTADTAAIVARAGYVAYHWTADDVSNPSIPGWLAWAAQHPAEANGAILLLHCRPASVDALPGWLDQLAAIGLQPTTLGQTLR
jgi:peptidoglycan/xylan/chitin deacetylase (PgdA/CDA1 family)